MSIVKFELIPHPNPELLIDRPRDMHLKKYFSLNNMVNLAKIMS